MTIDIMATLATLPWYVDAWIVWALFRIFSLLQD